MKTKTNPSKSRTKTTRDILAAGTGGDLTLTGTVTIQAAAPDKPGPRRFEMDAYFGGELRLSGLPYPVVVDLATLKGTDKTRPILKDHDRKIVVGHTDHIDNDRKSLRAGGVFSGAGPAAREVIEAADNGFPWAVSIGASPGRLERVAAGASVTVNNQTFKGPLLVARGAALKEISFVSIGADEDASARIAATAAKDIPMDFEQWLEARGFTPADLSDAQKASLEAMYKGEKNGKATKVVDAPDLDAVLGLERDKETRRKEIVNLTARALQDNPGQLQIIEALSRQAVEGDWDQNRYELELLRATRPQAGHRARAQADDGLTAPVIEAALCLTGGIEKPEDEFGEQVLEAADKRWRHGLGLGELLMLFARRNGHDALSTRNIGPMLRAAFAEAPDSRMLQASGISTLSLPGILSNVANRFLKTGFDSVESTWRAIAAIRPVRDFKQISSYSLTGDFQYIEVAPGGQLKHATVGEETYTNQAKTYGRMFGIDRRDIINDDLGALTQVPRRLGRGGALKFNEVFWTAFMNNASFFTAGNNNYFDGATTNLQISSLTSAETLFLNQTDPDGKPLAVTPRILLVPNALNVTASSLMRDAQLNNTTANTVFTTGNPHAGKFTVARSSYLSNSSITGYSTTAWYLLADPNDVAVIEAAFLNGVETPTVEQADADFHQLGIQMRGYHDFGVALQEPRAGVKSLGAAA